MDRTSPPPPPWTWWPHYGLYVLLIVYVFTFVVAPALREETFGYADGHFRDFASIMVMAKALWSGEPTLPDGRRPGYDLDSLLAVNRDWLRQPIDQAMPFPYSPTMLYLLGPLCPLPMVWAFVVWTVLNLMAIGWLISQRDCPRFISPIVFLTPTAISCFTLGQSAIVAVAGLIYLGRETFRKPVERGGNIWLMAVVLWALTARPQLAITAGVALLAARQWRPVLLAVVFTLVTTAVLTPMLGTRWITDYITLLSHYDLVTAPDTYKWALVPDYMNNFRALLKVEFSVRDDWATTISSGVWLLSLIGVLVSTWVRKVPPAVIWGVCVLLQLLLCPHVNSYELILLYAVLVYFLHVVFVSAEFRMKAIWIIPLLLCLTTVGEPFEAVRREVLIAGLLTIAGLFAWLYGVALLSSLARVAKTTEDP